MTEQSKGKLYLIPTLLGEKTAHLEVLPLSIRTVIQRCDHYIVEHEKAARRFIKQVDPKKSQPALQFSILNKFTEDHEIASFLDPCLQGKTMGLMSDAGAPGVADPGSLIVSMAHRKGIEVYPLVGPSSILLAMMASGMNGQNFSFNGYLPIEKSERKSKLRFLESLSRKQNQSQAFIETPYRNTKLLEDIQNACNPDTRLCVACDLTQPTQFIKTLPVSQWKNVSEDFHKRPCIFILHG